MLILIYDLLGITFPFFIKKASYYSSTVDWCVTNVGQAQVALSVMCFLQSLPIMVRLAPP